MSRQTLWLRVLLEGVVIVASILLAFGIDAWWADRQERRAEQVYIQRIIADLRETRGQILENAAHYESLLGHGTAIQPILTGVDDLPADTLGFLASVLQASRITDPVVARSAYDDLISTGNLRVIQSDSLRAALSRFYANVENQLNPVDYGSDQAPYRETVRSILPADLQMNIRASCLDAAPLGCGTDLSALQVGAVARAVLAEPGLDRKLNFSMQAMSIRLGFVLDREGFSGGFGVVIESIDALLALLGAADQRESTGVSRHLFVWTTDSDSVDLNFLAVLDADPGSPSYGSILNTLPVPTAGRVRGHHTEHRMPQGGRLFANDFGTGKTYVLDLRNPSLPTVADSFSAAGPLMSPHSFERLPTGNVLATFQNEGPGNSAPGGLAELDQRGRVVRWARGAAAGRYVRPYSLAVVPKLDRVVTGSADMRGAGDSRLVQVWRLSDLTLLASIGFPEEWGPAAEPRLLADGETVLVTTFGCKLLRVVGLDSDAPSLTLAHEFGGKGCALPVVVGKFWIQAVPGVHGLVALDVSNPEDVREASRVELGADDWPHWISLDPGHRRMVVTGYAGTRHRVLIVDFEPVTGQMTVDLNFTSPDSSTPGVSFDRLQWPHGATGPGDPHGAVFSLP